MIFEKPQIRVVRAEKFDNPVWFNGDFNSTDNIFFRCQLCNYYPGQFFLSTF